MVKARPMSMQKRHTFVRAKHNLLGRELQLFVEFSNLCVKLSKGNRQTRGMHFQGSQHFAESPAGKVIGQLHQQTLGFFDRWKKCVRFQSFDGHVCHFQTSFPFLLIPDAKYASRPLSGQIGGLSLYDEQEPQNRTLEMEVLRGVGQVSIRQPAGRSRGDSCAHP